MAAGIAVRHPGSWTASTIADVTHPGARLPREGLGARLHAGATAGNLMAVDDPQPGAIRLAAQHLHTDPSVVGRAGQYRRLAADRIAAPIGGSGVVQPANHRGRFQYRTSPRRAHLFGSLSPFVAVG